MFIKYDHKMAIKCLSINVEFCTHKHKLFITHYHPRKLICDFYVQLVRNLCISSLIKNYLLILKICGVHQCHIVYITYSLILPITYRLLVSKRLLITAIDGY